MGKTTIAWSHYSFNPWVGCTKVSPGCAHCYAEFNSAARVNGVRWGKGHARHRTAESTWRQPLGWDKRAAKVGVRYRVFCASLADVFDEEVLPQWRMDLFKLIEQCKNLDWMLLTKRPLAALGWVGVNLPTYYPNVWLGVSVEDQKRADERIPILLKIPATIRFLSVEPMLERIGLVGAQGIDLAIFGGESGPGARQGQKGRRHGGVAIGSQDSRNAWRRSMTEDELRAWVKQQMNGKLIKELAYDIGVSPQYLGDFLRGRKRPGSRLLRGLGLRKQVSYEHDQRSSIPPQLARQVQTLPGRASAGVHDPGR